MPRSLMIGFCGAGSTGKTTVAKLLAEQKDLVGEIYYPSIVRDVMKDWGINEVESMRLSPDEMKRLQVQIFEAKINQDMHGRGIYDRTPCDQLAYLVLRSYFKLNDQDFFNAMQAAKRAMSRYDLVFFFPPYPEIPYENDGFRVNNLAWRFAQSHVMEGLLKEIYPRYRTMPMGTPESRLQVVLNWIHVLRSQQGSGT